MRAGSQASSRPWITLTALFCAWKVLLLVVAAAAPGPGYDTSTQILLWGANRTNHDRLSLFQSVVAKLTRWDAVYFASGAKDGNVFEQDWAFSWALKIVVGFLVKGRLVESCPRRICCPFVDVSCSCLRHCCRRRVALSDIVCPRRHYCLPCRASRCNLCAISPGPCHRLR